MSQRGAREDQAANADRLCQHVVNGQHRSPRVTQEMNLIESKRRSEPTQFFDSGRRRSEI